MLGQRHEHASFTTLFFSYLVSDSSRALGRVLRPLPAQALAAGALGAGAGGRDGAGGAGHAGSQLDGAGGGDCSAPTSTCVTRVGCTASSGLGVDVFPSSGVASLQLAAPAQPGLLASSLLREHRSRCGPALPLLGAAQRCCHQLTAHYYKTLPPGFKRLEESRSGFSWSHSQRSVPLTFETKCPVLKIINGKYDKKIN